MYNKEFPSNIKQMGSISEGMRIYMEDFVFTFVQNYCGAEENGERLLMLLGRYMTIDSIPVLFINGAIEGRFCLEDDGMMVFTDKSYDYILNQKDKYFPKAEIVGWVQSQPGYGTYLSSMSKKYHKSSFRKPYQVLFITDPAQKINAFFTYDEDCQELVETGGYFIYYDKNTAMREYMADSNKDNVKVQPPLEIEEVTESGVKTNVYSRRKSASEMQIRNRQAARKRRIQDNQKRTISMLSGLCAVMFLICAVLGAGLIRSEDRITLLEQNLNALNTAYRNTLMAGDAQSAFAPGAESGVVLSEDGNDLLKNDKPEVQTPPPNQQSQADPEVQSDQQTQVSPAPASPEPAPASPSPAPQAAVDTVPETYTVQRGDNLLFISQKFYGTSDKVAEIMELNNLTDPDTIFFGKVLALPRP